jgi:AraC-like DNA-binding protein
MAKNQLYQPYEIAYREWEQFPGKLQQNNFFLLVYVAGGTGVQVMNNHKFSYRKGNLFLITPQDSYSFTIAEKSKFFTISFNNAFIKKSKDTEWITRMDFILTNASHRPGCILKNKPDKPVVASLVETLILELTGQQLYHSKVIQQLVNTIILIVARNIALKLPKKIKENTGEPILDILHYIQENIFTPSLLKAESISRHQGISLPYLGRYFKKQTGETLQHYITNYKLRLVEMRLLHTDMRINEIVYELNFTDESHLNRIFKKYRGVSPTEFRKNGTPAQASGKGRVAQ